VGHDSSYPLLAAFATVTDHARHSALAIATADGRTAIPNRHRDLSRHRTGLASRLHAVLCELTPGGFTGEISAAQATRLLDDIEPEGAVAAAPLRARPRAGR
jgi:hypothetical protein